MKVFISWSGEKSKKVAEELKEWIPCVLQSVEVFYSPEDIEKGENWDKKLTEELSECDYGIVCLTFQNWRSPWLNFEAGAIANSPKLDTRVTALMVDMEESDIKGPLKKYQTTKFEKKDIWELILDINKKTEKPVEEKILKMTFEMFWDLFNKKIENIIEKDQSAVNVETMGEEAVHEVTIKRLDYMLSMMCDFKKDNDEKKKGCTIGILQTFHIGEVVKSIIDMEIKLGYRMPELENKARMLRDRFIECSEVFGM